MARVTMTGQRNLIPHTDADAKAAVDARDAKLASAKAAVDALMSAIKVVERAEKPDVS